MHDAEEEKMKVDIKLVYGDFFKEQEQLESGSFDLIITDPPYGILERAGHSWDVPIDWIQAERIFSRLLKPNGQVIIFANHSLMIEIISTFSEKLVWKHFHIWKKSCPTIINKYNPRSDAEYILIFKQKSSNVKDLTFNPYESGIVGKPYSKINHTTDLITRGGKKGSVDINEDGKRWITTILEGPSKPNMEREERTSHPTQKPLTILRELIRVYSNPNDKVFDCFAGSASILISAFLENRNSIGFEIEEKYFNEAQTRISRYRAQTSLNLQVVS
jgi:DNA modification methylase